MTSFGRIAGEIIVGKHERRVKLKLTAMDAAIIFGAVMGLILSLLSVGSLRP